MKKIALSTLFFIGVWTNINCQSVSTPNSPTTISSVKITDKTFLHYYMNGKRVNDTTITDFNKIKELQIYLDSMKEVKNISQKYNLGYYTIKIFFSNKTTRELDVVYTVYDGVIIAEVGNDKEYRNNDLEQLVSSFFRYQPNK